MNSQLELAPCGFLEFNSEGVISYVNGTLAGWVGVSSIEIVGKKFESLLTLSNRIFYQTHLFPLVKLNGAASEISLSLVTKEGPPFPVMAFVGRNNNTFQCVLVTIRERQKYDAEILKARRKAEDALQSNEELKMAKQELTENALDLDYRLRELTIKNEEMLTVSRILAHDLREPLRKVRVFADLLREETETVLTEEGSLGLTKICTESDRSLSLITEVQRFLESANINEPLTQVDLNALLEDVNRAARHSFTEWNLTVEALPQIFARPKQLKILFAEVLGNAIKFRSTKRKLEVKVRGQKIQQNSYQATKERYSYRDFLQIEVSDNGAGFDPKYRQQVFILFKKADLKSEGLGLGLPICRRIAAVHYGAIEIETIPDRGTTVTLRLPIEP